MTEYKLDRLRSEFHEGVCREALSMRSGTGGRAPNIADSSSHSSVRIATRVAELIPCAKLSVAPTGQTAGKVFTDLAARFLELTLAALSPLRPWQFEILCTQPAIGIGAYAQYQHLARVREAVERDPELRSWIGSDYLVRPDLVVSRTPYTDSELEAIGHFAGPGSSGRLSPMRGGSMGSGATRVMHASVSCKWTIRSDRAQNSRTEGLNMMRNRKGRAPHICVLTFEPLPSRIESIAAGTGDVDCVYHAALYELAAAVEEVGSSRDRESLDAMISGERLRDISDLALDLLG